MKFFGISGTGINPGIDADAASHNFGTVQVGEYGTDKTFTIENDGTSDLNATPTITGTDAAEFFFSSQPNCASVTPDSTCQIIVNLRPLGSAGPRSANLVIANNTKHMAGAITSNAADKASRFLQLCDAFEIPVVSLVDTPGMMVGIPAEKTGLVRHTSRLLVTAAALRVPFIAVVLRRAYGLGAQAMMAGSLHEPLLTVAWPSAHLGPMGLEGAVRLALRKELEAIEDDEAREQRVRDVTALAQENAKALNAAQLFELDDVIDPARTRALIASTLVAATAHTTAAEHGHRFVDTW